MRLYDVVFCEMFSEIHFVEFYVLHLIATVEFIYTVIAFQQACGKYIHGLI